MILIAGIGNIFLGDDAFGSEVARRLAARNLPSGVQVVDFGIRGLDLVYALLNPHDAAILVDAMPRGGEPGTLYVLEPELPDGDACTLDIHEMNPLRVLSLARALGANLQHVRIVGCEPQSLGNVDEGEMGLSACVSAAVDQAIVVIESLIQEVHV
jgi:hydrogenase maturation protease